MLRLYPSAPALRAATSLRAESLEIDGAKVTGRTHGSVLEVPLPRPLVPGQRLALTLSFHGLLRRLAAGEDDLAQAALQALGGGGRAGTPGGRRQRGREQRRRRQPRRGRSPRSRQRRRRPRS